MGISCNFVEVEQTALLLYADDARSQTSYAAHTRKAAPYIVPWGDLTKTKRDLWRHEAMKHLAEAQKTHWVID